MFAATQNQKGGFLLIGFCAVMAVWLATAGVMFKAYRDGGLSLPQCQVVCAEHTAPAHG
jgi:hypothetical protein